MLSTFRIMACGRVFWGKMDSASDQWVLVREE